MFHEIEAALNRLVGTRLTNTGSAADLQWFTFSRANELDLSLHVSCPWRVTLRSRILLGDDDYRRPASPDTPEWEYESGTISSRWRHVQTDAVREMLGAGLDVLTVQSSAMGDFAIQCEQGLMLEAFPTASRASHDETEYWRMFETHSESPHFVVGTDGIERVDA